MQYAQDDHVATIEAVEDQIVAFDKAADARSEVVAIPAKMRVVDQSAPALLKAIEQLVGGNFVPRTYVAPDFNQISSASAVRKIDMASPHPEISLARIGGEPRP